MFIKSELASFLPLVLLLSGFGPAPAQDREDAARDRQAVSDSAAGDSLSSLVAEALQNNPALKAAAFQVGAARLSPDQVWYLEPPEFDVDFFRTPIHSFPNPVENGTEVDYSMQQTFPFPGKISSRIQAGNQRVGMSEAELASLQWKIIREVKNGYYRLYLLDRRLEINRDDQALLNEFVAIARKRYEVGTGNLADILRAQTELITLQTDHFTLTQTRRSDEARLNALLNRKTDRPFPPVGALNPDSADWTLPQIRPLIEEYHPELRRLKAEAEMRAAEQAVTAKDFYPDFMVKATYMDMNHAADFWSLMVGMNLPLAFWSAPKYRAGYGQSVANLNQAKAEEADLANLLAANAQDALLQTGSDWNLVQVSKHVLIPQAEEALQSALSAYQDGKTEFLNLLDAYRALNQAKLDGETAVMELFAGQAELEQAVGLSLDEIRKKLSQGDGK